MVPTATIGLIVLNMLLGAAVPAAALILLKRRYHLPARYFFLGCGVMLVFALILEQMMHSLILFGTPAGPVILGTPALYALYGGLMAGLFEETGRLLAMRFLMRSGRGDPRSALAYGAGHAGFEVFMLLTLGMVNNLLYSVMNNAGQLEQLLAPLDETNRAVLLQGVEQLIRYPSWLLLLAPVERIAAAAAQLSLSVVVWRAAGGEKILWRWYLLAIGLHCVLDASAAWLSQAGVPVLIIEAAVWAMAAGFVCIAVQVWKKAYRKEE